MSKEDAGDHARLTNVHGREESGERCDELLITLVKAGDQNAAAELYSRHRRVALHVAYRHTGNWTDAEDFVSEGFANVLTVMRRGGGPTVFFRAYLLTTIARLAAGNHAKTKRENPTGSIETFDQVVEGEDPVVKAFERETVAKAFRNLPERWQAALWYSEVDGMKPAAIAPILGLSPNSVAALTTRAREGLRQAYLQEHLRQEPPPGCAASERRLGSYARGGLKGRSREAVRAHVEECPHCAARLLYLQDVGSGLRTLLFPAVVGFTFAHEPWKNAVTSGVSTWGKIPRLERILSRADLVYSVATATIVGAAVTIATVGSVENFDLPAQLWSGLSSNSAASRENAGPPYRIHSSPELIHTMASPPPEATHPADPPSILVPAADAPQTEDYGTEAPAPRSILVPAADAPQTEDYGTEAPAPRSILVPAADAPQTEDYGTEAPAPPSILVPPATPFPDQGSLPQTGDVVPVPDAVTPPKITRFDWWGNNLEPASGLLVVLTGRSEPTPAEVRLEGPGAIVPDEQAEAAGWSCAVQTVDQLTICTTGTAATGPSTFNLSVAPPLRTAVQTLTATFTVQGAVPTSIAMPF